MSSFCTAHFFNKKVQRICVSLDINFNELLTTDIVSFEQLGPVVGTCSICRGSSKSTHNSIKNMKNILVEKGAL